MEPLDICANCNTQITNLHLCAKCDFARYCSTECRSQHIDTHETVCAQIRNTKINRNPDARFSLLKKLKTEIPNISAGNVYACTDNVWLVFPISDSNNLNRFKKRYTRIIKAIGLQNVNDSLIQIENLISITKKNSKYSLVCIQDERGVIQTSVVSK